MDGRGDGIIILSDEIDETPADPAAAAQSLADAIDRTGAQIGAAASEYLRQISSPEAISLLGKRLAQSDEPERTELDTVAAEYKELENLLRAEIRAEWLARLPQLDGSAQAIPRNLADLPFPLDKINTELFAHNAGRGTISTESRKQRAAGVELLTALSLEFVGKAAKMHIRKLTPFDRRVLLTVGGLYLNGLDIITFSQIHAKMGGTSVPNERQRDRIWTALVTLCNAWIEVDNRLERAIISESPKIKMGFHLLEGRLGAIDYRGSSAEAIRVLASPQWLDLATKRGDQITRVPFALFSNGLSLTDSNIALSDWLADRAARCNRNSKAERHIRLDSAANKAGLKINNRSARQKLKKKVSSVLGHFAEIGFIEGFSEYENGYTIQPKKGGG